jgi:hypothetical protein
MFLITFLELLFLKSCAMLGAFNKHCPFLPCFIYAVHSSLYYQHGQHVKGVIIIKSYLGMR